MSNSTPTFNDEDGRLILAHDRWGIWEGETRGGTQEVGGPSGASRKRATTFVGARFLPSIAPSTTLLTLNPTNDSHHDATTMTRQQRHGDDDVNTQRPSPPLPSTDFHPQANPTTTTRSHDDDRRAQAHQLPLPLARDVGLSITFEKEDTKV